MGNRGIGADDSWGFGMPRMGLTSAKVVQEAARIADEVGLDQATLSNVADQLGVRVPSLYKHVEGLADLQSRIALGAGRNLVDALRTSVEGKSGRDALLSAFTAHRRYATTHPGQFRALANANSTSMERVEFDGSFTDILLKIMADYGVHGAEAEHSVRAVRAALTGYAALEAVHSFDRGEDVEASFYAMIALFDRGLTAPVVAAKKSGGFRLPGLPGLPGIQLPGR